MFNRIFNKGRIVISIVACFVLISCTSTGWKSVIDGGDIQLKTNVPYPDNIKVFKRIDTTYTALRTLFEAKNHPKQPVPVKYIKSVPITDKDAEEMTQALKALLKQAGNDDEDIEVVSVTVENQSGQTRSNRSDVKEIIIEAGDNSLKPTVLHELTHLLLHLELAAMTENKPWLNEGVAGYLECADVDESQRIVLPDFEKIKNVYGRLLKNSKIKEGVIFKITSNQKFYNLVGDPNISYAQSALIVGYYLTNLGEGSFRGKIEALAKMPNDALEKIEQKALEAIK